MVDASEKPGVEISVGARLRELRLRHRFSMRELAKRADVAVSYVAGVEAERISPTITTLRKLLGALDTDLGTFFAEAPPSPQWVFRHDEMRAAADANRRYTFILPRRADVHIEMLDEVIAPGETPEFETLSSDLAGYVLQGKLYIEVEGEERQLLTSGDAFYVPTGKPVRGISAYKAKPVHLLTVYTAPRY
jgi:transcriptional regulator with XRE-family HTH domain